jgi:hypothetical protein
MFATKLSRGQSGAVLLDRLGVASCLLENSQKLQHFDCTTK